MDTSSLTDLLLNFYTEIKAKPVSEEVELKNQMSDKPECKYGAECIHNDPAHFRDYKHSFGTDYLKTIGERIDTYKDAYIDPLFNLISDNLPEITDINYYKVCQDIALNVFQDWFIKTGISDSKPPGARFATTKSSTDLTRVRFFAEDWVYFYLLAITHKYYPDYIEGTKNEKLAGFLNILFLTLEQSNITGEYIFYPDEYATIFGHAMWKKNNKSFHAFSTRSHKTNNSEHYFSMGIGIFNSSSENLYISLSNSSLTGSITKSIAPPITRKRKKSKSGGGRRKSMKNKKRRTKKKRSSRKF